jgi:NitT/TauT family transport system permease protein
MDKATSIADVIRTPRLLSRTGIKNQRVPERPNRSSSLVLIPVGLALLVGIWSLLVRLTNYPAFILPSPDVVGARFLQALADGTLWEHTQVTLLEMAGGMVIGVSTATLLGYLLAKNPIVERVLEPYIIASQTIPAVALAPLLIIWLGPGLWSKILVCALVVFFPILINTVVGLRSVNHGLRDLMRALQASRWQTFSLLEVPAALPVLLGGLKVGVTLSVIGAVVGEFVGANRGLGFLINVARGLFDTPLMFVAIITLVIIALSLYLIVVGLEKGLLAWRP